MKSDFIKELQELDIVVNPPFNYKTVQNYLLNKVNKQGFDLVTSPYYSYVHVSQNTNKPKLVLFCHTDHPAFIFKNETEGILFGKFDINIVHKNLPIYINVYDKNGKRMFKEKIVSMDGRNFKTSGKHLAKPNYSARFVIKEKRINGDKVGLYSADNYLGVLSLLALLKNKKIPQSKYDLYFVFNHHEEVFQLGSMKFGQENILNINHEDILINIDTWREGSDGKLLLQLTEKGTVYSSWSKKINKAELLAKHAAKISKTEFIIGKNTGSGDSRILNQYKLTPNLISIGIPRDKYHNISKKGEIGYEVFSIKTFKSLIKWLESICLQEIKDIPKNIKNTDRKNLLKYEDKNFLKNTFEQNISVFNKYKGAINRGYFFHEKIFEKFLYRLKKS